jgi:hypothetical protein
MLDRIIGLDLAPAVVWRRIQARAAERRVAAARHNNAGSPIGSAAVSRSCRVWSGSGWSRWRHPRELPPGRRRPFVANIGLVSVKHQTAAVAFFGVGIYFWLLLRAVVAGRLFFGSPLPQPFRPVPAILLSPPGVAFRDLGRTDRPHAGRVGTRFLLGRPSQLTRPEADGTLNQKVHNRFDDVPSRRSVPSRTCATATWLSFQRPSHPWRPRRWSSPWRLVETPGRE